METRVSSATKEVTIGAAAGGFHNFNTYFKDNEEYDVVGFTAAQVPDISGRRYPIEQ